MKHTLLCPYIINIPPTHIPCIIYKGMAHTFITCSFCGKQEDIEAFRSIKNPLVSRMRNKQICFDCAYWMNWQNNPEPDTIVISGKLYKLTTPLKQLPLNKTRARALRFIVKTGTKEVYTITDMILRGAIPKRLSQLIPDQYKFITRDEYRRIIGFDADMCLSKGCFDRYHCLWYRADIAEPDEPWNIVPKDYQIGGENCPSFINKYGFINNN